MPRVKSSNQIEALERQQAELMAKLKAAKAKARDDAREERIERAKAVGLAVLAELEESPESETALALLVVLDARLTRRADREALGLGETAAKPEAARGGVADGSAASGEGASVAAK